MKTHYAAHSHASDAKGHQEKSLLSENPERQVGYWLMLLFTKFPRTISKSQVRECTGSAEDSIPQDLITSLSQKDYESPGKSS